MRLWLSESSDVPLREQLQDDLPIIEKQTPGSEANQSLDAGD
jgi:hypothetical protein